MEIKYKLNETQNFQSQIYEFSVDVNSNLQNEGISDSENMNIIKFSSLIRNLKENPTTFTLIDIKRYIQKPEIKKCSQMIDEQVIEQLFNLANGKDDNIRQNSFYVIGSIILNFPQKITILFQYDIIELLTNFLSEQEKKYYVSSIYFVINSLIVKSSYIQKYFSEHFDFKSLFQNAYTFMNVQNNDEIVECFSSIAKYVEISDKNEAYLLVQIFYLALAKKISSGKDRIEINSYNLALIGIINFLNYQKFSLQDKKEVIESTDISVFLQFFIEPTEITAEIINATILTTHLFSLDISNIQNVLPQIVKLLKFGCLDPKYHIIINCINDIIQVCSDIVIQKLIDDLKIIEVIFNIMLESNVKTKIEIYSCFNSIISRLPKSEYIRIINIDFIGYLFDLIEMDDPEFMNKIIDDIFQIFQVATEIGEIITICSIFNSISAKTFIENLLQNDKINEMNLSHLQCLYEQIIEYEQK